MAMLRALHSFVRALALALVLFSIPVASSDKDYDEEDPSEMLGADDIDDEDISDEEWSEPEKDGKDGLENMKQLVERDFSDFDKDKSKTLNSEEVEKLIESTSIAYSFPYFNWRDFDEDADEHLSLSELLALADKHWRDYESASEEILEEVDEDDDALEDDELHEDEEDGEIEDEDDEEEL